MASNPVLIYDGDCKFCQLSLEFGIRNLKVFPSFVSFQKIRPDDFGLSEAQVRREIWLVGSKSSEALPLGGHLAAAEILLMQENVLVRLAGWFMKTPPTAWLAKATYHWIAANRHRLPGGTKQCNIQDTYRSEL